MHEVLQCLAPLTPLTNETAGYRFPPLCCPSDICLVHKNTTYSAGATALNYLSLGGINDVVV